MTFEHELCDLALECRQPCHIHELVIRLCVDSFVVFVVSTMRDLSIPGCHPEHPCHTVHPSAEGAFVDRFETGEFLEHEDHCRLTVDANAAVPSPGVMGFELGKVEVDEDSQCACLLSLKSG